MADQGGVSRLSSGAVSGFTGQRTIDGTAQSRSAVSVSNAASSSTANAGAGRRDSTSSGSTSQTINYAGKVLSKTAPRGTYLNIVV
jgi:hypothetical protein